MTNFVNSILATAMAILSLGPFVPLRRILASILKYFYKTPPPEALMTTPQLIEHNGYSVEEHSVTTEDGYILTLFRIGSKNPGTSVKGRPVVIQHGYLTSSDDFLLLPPDVALPYILTEKGHDVWLSNSRGNNYSTKHTTLTRNDSKYWDFGVDELGQYDVPAILNYVLGVTKYSQLNWIGHSLGTASFFISLSDCPELNEKVNKMVALSPAYYVSNSTSPLLVWPTKVPVLILQIYFKYLTGGHIIPNWLNYFLRRHAPYFAHADFLRKRVVNLFSAISGHNRQQMTPTSASLIAGHALSNTSGKLLIHIRQTTMTDQPRKFDYGPKTNQIMYGTSTPPGHDLSRVRIPVQAWYGVNDLIIDHKDAKRTISDLGNVYESIEIPHPKWTHMDFIYGKQARFYIYDKVLPFLED